MTGTIAYARPLAQNGRLTWIDRRGNPLGSPGTPEGDYTDFRLSPDETRLAASLVDPKTNVVDIWITDLARGSNSRVGSGGGVTAAAVWSPDGTRLAFRSNRTGVIDLYERSAAGGGGRSPVAARSDFDAVHPVSSLTDWSPEWTAADRSAAGERSVAVAPRRPMRSRRNIIDSPGARRCTATFSPDGRSGGVSRRTSPAGLKSTRRRCPDPIGSGRCRPNGGYEPRWRADGREIYYLSEDRTLMAVSVGAGPSFGIPKPLFQTHVPTGVTALRTHYVPSRDGQRFLVNVSHGCRSLQPITVVLNWTASPEQVIREFTSAIAAFVLAAMGLAVPQQPSVARQGQAASVSAEASILLYHRFGPVVRDEMTVRTDTSAGSSST